MNRHPVLAILLLSAALFAALAEQPRPAIADDEVSALQLAEWIRQRHPDLLLIDAQTQAPSDQRALPGAHALAGLDSDSLEAHRLVVIYAVDDFDPARAQALRKRWNRPDLLRLHGGLRAWNEHVLYPVIRADASARQQADFVRRAELSRYFGGSPQRLDPGAAARGGRSRQGC